MKSRFRQHAGLTLVELLVAIAILAIVVALIVPRLRLVSKDRNIREAARVAGSVFSSARDRAIAEGRAGVIIERNLNFVAPTASGNNVYYAGTRLFQMRAMPPYVGDFAGAVATTQPITDINGNPIQIQAILPLPLEDNVLQANDSIRFNNSMASYRIAEVLPPNGMLQPLVLSWDDNPGEPILNLSATDFTTNWPAPIFSNVPFSIERQPRIIESSAVDLPAGYIIDLRYSGPLDTPAPGLDNDNDTHSAFGLGLPAKSDPTLPENRQLRILFNQKGEIDLVSFNNFSFLAGQSLFLFVNEYRPRIATPNTTTEQAAVALLANPNSLWLTVGLNGGVNISYNTPPVPDTVPAMIANARTISRTRASANQ